MRNKQADVRNISAGDLVKSQKEKKPAVEAEKIGSARILSSWLKGKKINLIPIRIRITTKPVRGLRDRVGGDTFRVKIRENTRKIPKNI